MAIILQRPKTRHRRRRAGTVLYLKSAYLSADDPLRAAQAAIDEKLLSRGVVDASGEGPGWEELQTALKEQA
jgi:hypothetical protein